MPQTIFGYVLRYTARHQIALALLSAAVFLLSTAPLELQRRIVNDLTQRGAWSQILWLAAAYATVSLTEQTLKLALNVYRGWVAEAAVRSLRRRVLGAEDHGNIAAGLEIALILDEVEPIGGFTALSVSEPLLQGGILISVIGYMIVLSPTLALIGLVFFLPQAVLVPLLQAAINRRAEKRILLKRTISGTIVEHTADRPRQMAIETVFSLNMGIYKLKYLMNLLMNLMHHLSVAAALAAGGWLALQGRIEVGTVVAVVGGLGKLNDPWGDLVNWARELSVVGVKYRLFAEAVSAFEARGGERARTSGEDAGTIQWPAGAQS